MDRPHTFFTPKVFLFSISLATFCKQISLLRGSTLADATLKLNFEKLKPAIFLTFTTE